MLSSFRVRAMLWFGALALAVVAGLSLQLGRMMSAQLARDQGDALHELAHATAVLLAEGLHERLREVDLLARSTEVQRMGLDPVAWTTELERLQRSRTHYAWIGVTDAGGTVRAATGGLLVGRNVAERPWFQAALQGSFVGDPHAAKLLASLLPARAALGPLRLIDFAAPLQDAEGRTIGTLGVHGDWAWARDVIAALRSERKRDAGVRVFILDRAGQVIHHPDGPDASVTLPPGEGLPTVPRLQRWSDGESYLSAAAALPARRADLDLGWTVLVRQPAHEALGTVVAAQHAVWAAGSVAVVMGMLLAWLLLGRFGRPLVDIAQVARRIEAGALDTPIPVTTHSRELEQLSTALRSMTEKLVGRERDLIAANEGLELRVAERTEALATANAALARLAHHDALTGLPNRRAADERLNAELARQRRYGGEMALLLVDVDHFKRINDGHGHAVGDAVLRDVALRLQASVRESDFCARFGGEEFVVLLTETDEGGARLVAEKLRAAVAAPMSGPVATVTASFGLAVSARGEEAGSLLERADEALYRAKVHGRNRVELAT